MRIISSRGVLKNMSSTVKNYQNDLTKIFTSQSVKERINTFRGQPLLSQETKIDSFNLQKGFSSHKSGIQKHEIPSIRNPSFLNFDTAKNLSQFIKSNKIAPNIRILHALAHIEYNAFMSYVDTYFTLSEQIRHYERQQQFKNQIKQIALDEGDHFCLLNDRLEELGWKYGSIPVIDQLCLAIQQTKNSLIERMARISLLHEGRGMKAISKLISQLRKQKDQKSIQILKIIEKEQIFHFENGVKWFKYICHQQSMNFDETLQDLLKKKQFRYLNVQEIKNAAKKFTF